MAFQLSPAPTPPGTPLSYFGTLADLYDKAGETNVNAYSSLDGEDKDAPQYDRIRARMEDADKKILFYLDTNGLVDANDVSTWPVDGTDKGFSLLTEAWAWYTVAALYNARGSRDTVFDANGNQRQIVSPVVRKWTDDANNLLMRYVQNRKRNVATLATTTKPNRLGWYSCG